MAENIDRVALAARLVFLQNAGHITAADMAGILIANPVNPAHLTLLGVGGGNRGRQQNLYRVFRQNNFISQQNQINGLSASNALMRAIALSHQVA